MALDFRPWVQWGLAGELSDYAFRHPLEPWTEEDSGVGGHATSAAGISESFVVREDTLVRLSLRVEEDELFVTRTWLRWARSSGRTFLFRFDQDRASTEYEWWLEEPVWSDPVVPQRDGEYQPMFRVPVVLRLEEGQVLNTYWSEVLG